MLHLICHPRCNWCYGHTCDLLHHKHFLLFPDSVPFPWCPLSLQYSELISPYWISAQSLGSASSIRSARDPFRQNQPLPPLFAITLSTSTLILTIGCSVSSLCDGLFTKMWVTRSRNHASFYFISLILFRVGRCTVNVYSVVGTEDTRL